MPRQLSRMDMNDAQSVALQLLAYLLAEPQRQSRFMATTGLQPGDVRGIASSPDFMASVLEYTLADESLLLAFCLEARVQPGTIAPAFEILSKHAGRPQI